MTTSETNAQVCVNCSKQTASAFRGDEMFGSGAVPVFIENIPMIKCRNCGIVYLEQNASLKIDEILTNPELHTTIVEMRVARID